MLDLVPAEIADVDKTLDTVLKLCEYTEVGDIAYGSLMLASYRIFLADILPRILGKLLETKGNLACLTVDRENLSLYFVAHLKELLCRVETWRP